LDEDLFSAVNKMITRGVDRPLVVSRDKEHKFIGIATGADIAKVLQQFRLN
jgi:predicted transcriptional regulator